MITSLVQKKNAVTKFLYDVSTNYATLFRKAEGKEGFNMCDMVAMAAVLWPQLIQQSQKMHGHIELAGTHTRGATVFDWYSKTEQKNVNVLLRMDSEGYRTICGQFLNSITI